MKRGALLLLFTLIVSSTFFFYRGFYQLSYADKFHLDRESRKEVFIIYPDTTINNEQFKFHLEGSIEGKAIISALAIYKSKKGSSDSTSLINLKLENRSGIDNTLRLPYYGRKEGDKVIIKYQPISIKQMDLTIRAGIFGLPFEHIWSRFL